MRRGFLVDYTVSNVVAYLQITESAVSHVCGDMVISDTFDYLLFYRPLLFDYLGEIRGAKVMVAIANRCRRMIISFAAVAFNGTLQNESLNNVGIRVPYLVFIDGAPTLLVSSLMLNGCSLMGFRNRVYQNGV